MRVEVYKNIRTGKYSARSTRTGVVIAREDVIMLKNVTFAVQPAGREKVRKEKKKNVHAFVRGELDVLDPKDFNTPVYYNPYLVDNFMVGDKEIFEAPAVILNQEGVWIK
jgi:hypothetical protein